MEPPPSAASASAGKSLSEPWSERPGVIGPWPIIGLVGESSVDGIDVGLFDFEPLNRSEADPRALAGSIKYKTIANKTFPFTPEERQYVLGLRAMRLEDGNEYAEGNYQFGEGCAPPATRPSKPS